MGKKPTNSEVDAYVYIKRELASLGWDTRNPERSELGQVYTQTQCLSEPEIRKCLGLAHPEYIVKVSESVLWVIEAKRNRTQQAQAISEAENDYARLINQGNILKALFISGVAGNDSDGYIVNNRFLENEVFVPITLNGKEMTGLLTPEIARRVLKSKSPNLNDVPIDQNLFLKKADKINEILHKGAVNINDRAKVMAALLLATLDESPLDLNVEPRILIKDINTRAENTLISQGKKEFFEYVRINLPTSKDNHKKYKKALVDTLQQLFSLNIKSAMNSGNDILGQFYEVFLKYGNWAQKMGIVLTPRHITQFASRVLDISMNDIVYDPTCGTGGFLVGALDHIKSQSIPASNMENFKKHHIFGLDQQPQLATLAIVNMIFRGDGRNNIIEGDCFTKWLVNDSVDGKETARFVNEKPEGKDWQPVTKVLMNPSFAIEKTDTKEYKFIQQALDQMADGHLLFSILPVGAMFEGGEEMEWRKNRLLKENTLLSVITFPPELFHPVGVHTLGIIVKKGVPHPINQNVLWVRAVYDGLVKIKGKRLLSNSEPDEISTVSPIIKAFIHDTSFVVEGKPEFIKMHPIDFNDEHLELVPEAYLDTKPIKITEIEDEIENLVRNTVAYLIREGKEKQ